MGTPNPLPRSYSLWHLFFSNKQHTRHCIAFGDELTPHPAMVEIILQPEIGVKKMVLDIGQSLFVVPPKKLANISIFAPLGCGSGIW